MIPVHSPNKDHPRDQRFLNVSTLVVKVTNRCNLDCSYCYEHIIPKGSDMSVEVFKELASRVIRSTSAPEITFLFHGGEPTLLDNSWYQHCLEYALELGRIFQKTIHFSIQTNLLALSESKIDLFKRFGIKPGVSLDNSESTIHSERGKESKVFRNFLRLREEGISCGILSTINESNYDQFYDICTFLHKEAGVKSFKANVALPVGRGYGKNALQADQIIQAQTDILRYMLDHYAQIIEQNTWLELRRFFAEDTQLKSTLCHDKVCGAGTRVLGVTTDGALLPCGRFAWSDRSFYLGTIQEENEMSGSVEKFMNLAPENWQHCTSCQARSICRFGCQAFIVRSQQKLNLECIPTQKRYQFFLEHQKALKNMMDAHARNARSSWEQYGHLYTFSTTGTLKGIAS
ncbi:MAG: radical SAM protein [Cytophagaceae bacterium]|jgi:uncharacterized protein|nr:radical SAM protein [Cytophagaceae bacterium]